MGKLSLLLLVAISLVLGFPTEASVEKEKTLAIIKPDGLFGDYTDKIKTIILESGFIILREMTLQLNESDVALFYAEHSGRSFFPSLVNYMTSGPVSIMVLEKANAIVDWRILIGPTDARKARLSHPGSIRAMCGSDLERNCVHGSDSPQSAAREITFFFGEMSSDKVDGRRGLDTYITVGLADFTYIMFSFLGLSVRAFHTGVVVSVMGRRLA